MNWFSLYRMWSLVVLALFSASIVVAQENPSPDEPYVPHVITSKNIPALEQRIPIWMEQASIPGLQVAIISELASTGWSPHHLF